MKQLLLLLIGAAFFAACSNSNPPADQRTIDSPPKHDSMEDALADLAPPSDIKQFKWFYSLFVKGITTKNENNVFNKFIHPENGVYVIESNGAMPQMTNVKDMDKFTTLQGKSFFTLTRDEMIEDPADEELPVVNCDSKDFYSKSGCFTQEQNTFKDEKIWKYCHLEVSDEKKVSAMAAGITRTVINTKNYRFYFSLIEGSWYISFIDMRKPCSA